MLLMVITGGLMLLAGIALSVSLIVQGFRLSVARGLMALLAPILLCAGLSALFLFAHRVALAEITSTEGRQQAEQEFEDKIDELDGLQDLKL